MEVLVIIWERRVVVLLLFPHLFLKQLIQSVIQESKFFLFPRGVRHNIKYKQNLSDFWKSDFGKENRWLIWVGSSYSRDNEVNTETITKMNYVNVCVHVWLRSRCILYPVSVESGPLLPPTSSAAFLSVEAKYFGAGLQVGQGTSGGKEHSFGSFSLYVDVQSCKYEHSSFQGFSDPQDGCTTGL